MLSPAAVVVADAGRDDDTVPGRIIIIIVVVVGCRRGIERVLSLRDSARRGDAHRHRRLFVDAARQSRVHVGRQLARDTSVPPPTARQPVVHVRRAAGRRRPTVPSPLHRHAVSRSFKAKFHYASWFEAGSKLVADRFEAGRRPASNHLRTRQRNGIWSRTC